MKTYLRKIVAFINDEEGASAIEYALLVALIALAIIGRGDYPWHQDLGDVHCRRYGVVARTVNGLLVYWGGAEASGLRPLPYRGKPVLPRGDTEWGNAASAPGAHPGGPNRRWSWDTRPRTTVLA